MHLANEHLVYTLPERKTQSTARLCPVGPREQSWTSCRLLSRIRCTREWFSWEGPCCRDGDTASPSDSSKRNRRASDVSGASSTCANKTHANKEDYRGLSHPNLAIRLQTVLSCSIRSSFLRERSTSKHQFCPLTNFRSRIWSSFELPATRARSLYPSLSSRPLSGTHDNQSCQEIFVAQFCSVSSFQSSVFTHEVVMQ